MQLDIRDKLKAYIKDKGLIQSFIAGKANITPAQFSMILNKTRRLEANELFDVCEAIGIEPTDLRAYEAGSVN